MNKHSYEATIEVDDEKIKGFIKDLFGDTEEYAKKQKRFNNEKIKDALIDFITEVEDGAKVLKRCYQKEFNQSLTSSNKSLI